MVTTGKVFFGTILLKQVLVPPPLTQGGYVFMENQKMELPSRMAPDEETTLTSVVSGCPCQGLGATAAPLRECPEYLPR